MMLASAGLGQHAFDIEPYKLPDASGGASRQEICKVTLHRVELSLRRWQFRVQQNGCI